jgi:hypothetical protein
MPCPICQSNNQQRLLSLARTPIYQHPLDADIEVPLPHHVDLDYLFCEVCGHAFQAKFDGALMDQIYANHYYTPAPDDIGHQFRDEFFSAIRSLITHTPKPNHILEIGSSSGEVLLNFKNQFPNTRVQGYEPSQETARSAISKGIPTKIQFFNPATVADESHHYDVVISRHVIEHIEDFDSFWIAINKITHSGSILLLETPSLESAMSRPSLTPFHVEHAHVFSSHSLTTLAARYYWYPIFHSTTESGNMVLGFSQQKKNIITLVLPLFSSHLQQLIHQQRTRLLQQIGHQKVLLWGAGAGGQTLISRHQLTPEKIIDGNPNKKGKKFCGLPWIIEYAPDVIQELQHTNNEAGYVIVIGSTFYREIRATLAEVHWQGGILSPYEWKSEPETGELNE